MNTHSLETRFIQLHNGAKGLRAELPVDVKTDPDDLDILHMRASDQTLDRYQEVIVAAGWKLDNYRKNPVIQNSHQYGDIIFTIGKALNTWVSGRNLLQTWKFAAQENPFAKIARDLYRGGYLRAASVGFVPLRWEDGKENSGYKRRYVEQELLEVSAVGIPANPNALALAIKDGIIKRSDLRELATILRHLTSAEALPRTAAVSLHSHHPAETLSRTAAVSPDQPQHIERATPPELRHPLGEAAAAAGLPHSRPPEQEFCNDQAGLAADARAPGRETNGAQWLQLVREVIELAERI